MHRTPSKRKQRAQLTLIYFMMVCAVLIGVCVLLMAILGYRFNRTEGTVEQGGLVQFDSRPNGAQVHVDSVTLANQTGTKITLTAGKHTVSMSRSGYSTWKKDVNVISGSILWLNYARLFPTSVSPQVIGNVGSASSVLVTEKSQYLMVVGDASKPELTVTRLDADVPALRRVTLPPASYTPAIDGTQQSFSLVDSDVSGRYVIIKHTFGEKTEFLSVDTQDDTQATKNITTLFGIDAKTVLYDKGKHDAIYMHTTSNELRRGSINDGTITGPLLTYVESFSQYDESTIVYQTQLNPTSKQRSVGYLTEGASKPMTVRAYNDNGARTLQLKIGKYYGDTYLAIVHGNSTEIVKVKDLPASGSDALLKTTPVTSFTTEGDLSFIRFSPQEQRFVAAQQGESLFVYDLELATLSKNQLGTGISREADWVDTHHIATTTGGELKHLDYDGLNAYTVAKNVADRPVAISDDDKYMYYFAPNEDGTIAFVRVKLID